MPSSSRPLKPGENNKELHKEVLGGIVSANGFFTGAVFLSITGTITPSSGIPSNCTAGDDISFNLFLFQIWSLVSYFLSTLLAMAAKLLVVYFDTDPVARTRKYKLPPPSPSEQPELLFHQSSFQCGHRRRSSQGQEEEDDEHRRGNTAETLALLVRPVMILSVLFSAAGSFLLLLSIINMVQIRLGLLSCGSTVVVITVVGPVLLILAGLVVYLFISWFFLKQT